MRYLRANTATIVTVGPFFDKTDGVTIETALTITNEKISMVVDNNDGSAPTLVLDNVTGATSATDNDLNYITNCDAGLMQLELTAANTNHAGKRAFLTITDAANHVPVFHEFMILVANVYDSLTGTAILNTNLDTIKTQTVTCAAGVTVLASVGTAATSTAQTGDSFALIGTTGSGLTSLATQASVNTIDDFVDGLETSVASLATASALATVGSEVGTILGRVIGTIAAGTHNPQTGDSFGVVNSGTHGNAALKILIDTVDTVADRIEADTIDIQTQIGVDGAGLTNLPAVTLANGAHGGAATTITAKSIAVANSDAGGVAVTLTGSGTGNSHAISLASTSGSAISAVSGSHGINVVSSAGKGLIVSGATGDIDADIAGTITTCTTVTNMLTAAAVNAEVDTALNTAIPVAGSTTPGSINDYLRKVKYEIVNAKDIEEDGDSIPYDDAGTPLTTVSAAYSLDSTTVKRKKLL